MSGADRIQLEDERENERQRIAYEAELLMSDEEFAEAMEYGAELNYDPDMQPYGADRKV